MQLLDSVLASLAANIALDEAVLLDAEDGGPEVLRLWEWPSPAVVLGAGCKLAEDVDRQACVADGVPILRRGSGGGTVLLGPGCLLFSLILSYERQPLLREIRSSYAWILDRIAVGLNERGLHVAPAGISDLAFAGRKVSGNSQQRKLGHVLHHGTLLYGFDIAQAGRYLRLPVRQPDYRRQRNHHDFLENLPLSDAELRSVLCRVWDAKTPLTTVPCERVERLLAEKYGNRDWIERR